MKEKYIDLGINVQLVPSGNHQENKGEWAIDMFKVHFIAVIFMVDPQFPLQYWEDLVDQ